MFNKANTAPLKNSNSIDRQSFSSGGFKRFGKKIYAVIAVIIVLVIAVALLVPQGVAVILLSADFTVGEKMVYETTSTIAFQTYNTSLASSPIEQQPNSGSINATQSIEVIDFDGEYYTLNHTMTMMLNDEPFSYSMTEKMNKTGYSTYIFNLGNTTQEVPNTGITSSSYLAQLISKPEVKVGDAINIPYPSISPSVGITGDLTITFKGIEDLTTPAGTYKVFRIDITSNNVSMHLPSSNISSNIDINYKTYLEYGTLRQIKSTTQLSVSYQSTIMNYTAQFTMEMMLNQHSKP